MLCVFSSDVCDLTLDPNTAHRDLSLSENNKKVTRVREDQNYPDHTDRLTDRRQVMCRERLIGRCYLEVERGGGVEIAVTYRTITRQFSDYDSQFGGNKKSWCLGCRDGDNRYYVNHNKNRTAPPVRPSGSNRVGVYIDSDSGTLSFYRVSTDTLTHLHTFQSTFTESLYAGFYLWGTGSSVSLC